MRLLPAVAALALAAQAAVAAPLVAQAGQADHDPDKAVKGGALPAGWSARVDRGDAANIKFTEMKPGWHLTLGPATVLYRAADTVSGDFHTVAKIHQMTAPKHPEGYGIVVGGRDLQGAGQQYTYFLVRGDGTYLIKQRTGADTKEVTASWTPSEAITKADSAGAAMNVIEVERKGDRLTFKANGKPVHQMTVSGTSTDGVVGIRANHNLDLHVETFEVHDL